MNKAFTLIELLVVISIITMLSSIVFSSLNNSRARARDTQRISDMKTYHNALQIFQLQEGAIPVRGNTYIGSSCWGCGGSANSLAFDQIISNEILNTFPKDPLYFNGNNGTGYVYRNSSSGHTWFVGDDDDSTYAIRFWLETDILGRSGWHCQTNLGIHRSTEWPGEIAHRLCAQG